MMMSSIIIVALSTVLVSGLEQSGNANKELGWKIGEMVHAVDIAVGADSSHGRGDAMLHGFQNQIFQDNEVLVNPRVSEVVAQANKMNEDNVENDYICKRNWSRNCLDGWGASGDLCQAPTEYEGGCSHLVSFAKASVAEKILFSKDCRAPWPCLDSCVEGHDYDTQLCPVGWEEIQDGFCVRENSVGVVDKCGSKYHFARMGVSEKERLTRVCSMGWPCMTMCQHDYNAVCPQGWVLSAESLCVAPATYVGDCSYGVDMSLMGLTQKLAFANKCIAPFPCLSPTQGNDRTEKAAPTTPEDGPMDSVNEKHIFSHPSKNAGRNYNNGEHTV